jgi:hypothetical protein
MVSGVYRRPATYFTLTHEEQLSISEANEDCSFFIGLLLLERQELLQRIPNRLKHSQIDFLLSDGWPLIVATDGRAKKLHSKIIRCQCTCGMLGFNST